MVTVPWKRLSPEALQGLVEEFVSREGTEYGPRPVPMGVKVAQVLRQLERGSAVIVFDEASGTCNIVPADRPPGRAG